VLDELEVLPTDQVLDVVRPPGDQVVNAGHPMALGDQALAEV
jgi:hypothetical protein